MYWNESYEFVHQGQSRCWFSVLAVDVSLPQGTPTHPMALVMGQRVRIKPARTRVQSLPEAQKPMRDSHSTSAFSLNHQCSIRISPRPMRNCDLNVNLTAA